MSKINILSLMIRKYQKSSFSLTISVKSLPKKSIFQNQRSTRNKIFGIPPPNNRTSLGMKEKVIEGEEATAETEEVIEATIEGMIEEATGVTTRKSTKKSETTSRNPVTENVQAETTKKGSQRSRNKENCVDLSKIKLKMNRLDIKYSIIHNEKKRRSPSYSSYRKIAENHQPNFEQIPQKTLHT